MTPTIESRITIKFQKFICRNCCSHKRASLHREITDIDLNRPDGIAICCSKAGKKTMKELHSIEAKSIRLENECRSTGNNLPKAFVQARKYYGNHNWLIIETNCWNSLDKLDKDKLINLCKNNKTLYSKGVGLAIVPSSYVTTSRIRIIVEPIKNIGDFENYYLDLEINCSNCN